MSRSLFESPPPPFNNIFERPPFHSNLHYGEVLAALRYGIIARKGLILLIGAAGVGKSTLLDQLTRELDNDVACIFQSNPDVDFSDLLRLILDNLKIADHSPDSLSMLQCCKVILRSQLETGRIVSLMIDNAERLRDETLEQLLRNFCSAAPLDRNDNLLQIVLAGRPELRDNLARAELHSLKPCAEMICQLQPLQNKDIAAYIETRLRAVNLPENIFNSAALDQIAAHTGGNPHLINAISNRALQVGDGSPVTQVTAEMVARAARSLDLSETGRPVKKPVKQNLEIPTDDTGRVGRTFLNSIFDHRGPWLWPPGRGQKTVRILAMLLLIAGAATWLHSRAGKSELSNSPEMPSEIASSQQKLASNADAPTLAKQEVPTAPAPGSETPVPQTGESATVPLFDTEKSAHTASPVPTEKAAEKPPVIERTPSVSASNSQAQPAGNAGARKKFLEAQVYRAIENRAIIGVTVSVIDGVIYLDGRVATEKQRSAAERAAQSVAGVDQVRNRIAVADS